MAKAKRTTRRRTDPAERLGIEEAWRYIDRFCRALWSTRIGGEPPETLASAISELRDGACIPPHEANMMHTIRTLRNQLVHENVEFGRHETAIARCAWSIVRAWAERAERDAWRLARSACEDRAA